MIEPEIQNFLIDRKEKWLKKNIESNTNDEEKAKIEIQANQDFSLEGWLPSAVERAKQLSLVSHPSKFSHPSAKTSAIIADTQKKNDGFLRSGNTRTVALDVFGNAAAMDVYAFLSLVLSDNQTILMHLEKNTSLIQAQLTIHSLKYGEIVNGLLAMRKATESSPRTSERVKQVFFPVEKGYHLLSVLTPSGLMFNLKKRINEMHFSDEAKEVREAKKKNILIEKNYSEIYDLSVIGFGGTKPQNISVLNSQNHGTAFLLNSCPPNFEHRAIQPPRINFFSNTLRHKDYNEEFKSFHNILSKDENNITVRNQRDVVIKSIVYLVAERLWLVRQIKEGWSDSEHYQQLPTHQKIWLDQKYILSREENMDWFEQVVSDLARWFINTYLKVVDNQSLSLGDEQISHLKLIINDCEVALR